MNEGVSFNITRTIVCGKTTCASAPGRFCDYVATQNFGTRPVCIAFEGEPIRLYDHDGWLQRCDACLKAEKKTVWHCSPPPEIGWWPASYSRDSYCLRWWNGTVWSQEARPLDTEEHAAEIAKLECLCSEDIKWTERWW